MNTEYQPFVPPPRVPVAFADTDGFRKLPNRGVYSITQSRRGSGTSAAPALEYSWTAFLPWGQQAGSARPITVLKYRRSTLDFLRETGKYLRTIRKPLVLPTNLKRIRRRTNSKKERKPDETENTKEFRKCYSMKYVGNIDGQITIQTHRTPLLRLKKRQSALRSSVSSFQTSDATFSTFNVSEPATPRYSPRPQVAAARGLQVTAEKCGSGPSANLAMRVQTTLSSSNRHFL